MTDLRHDLVALHDITQAIKDTVENTARRRETNPYFHNGHPSRFILAEELLRCLNQRGYTIVRQDT